MRRWIKTAGGKGVGMGARIRITGGNGEELAKPEVLISGSGGAVRVNPAELAPKIGSLAVSAIVPQAYGSSTRARGSAPARQPGLTRFHRRLGVPQWLNNLLPARL